MRAVKLSVEFFASEKAAEQLRKAAVMNHRLTFRPYVSVTKTPFPKQHEGQEDKWTLTASSQAGRPLTLAQQAEMNGFVAGWLTALAGVKAAFGL